MARPRKEPQDRCTCEVFVGLTPRLAEQARELASTEGFPSVAGLLRHLLAQRVTGRRRP